MGGCFRRGYQPTAAIAYSLLLFTNLTGYRLSKQIGSIGAPAISLRSESGPMANHLNRLVTD